MSAADPEVANAGRRGGWASALTILLCSAYLWTVAWLLLWSLVPVLFGMQPLVVHSNSMGPSVRVGDIVGIGDVPAVAEDGTGALGVNAVIAFRESGSERLTLHRIVANVDGGYRTKGDANSTWDSATVAYGDVVGHAQLLLPGAGWPRHWAAVGQWHLVGLFLLSLVAAWYGQRSEPAVRAELESFRVQV